jgi:hypothetical protein
MKAQGDLSFSLGVCGDNRGLNPKAISTQWAEFLNSTFLSGAQTIGISHLVDHARIGARHIRQDTVIIERRLGNGKDLNDL